MATTKAGFRTASLILLEGGRMVEMIALVLSLAVLAAFVDKIIERRK